MGNGQAAGSAEVSVSRRIPLRLFFPEREQTVPHCGVCGFSGRAKLVAYEECQARMLKGTCPMTQGNRAKMISTESNPMDHEPLAKDKERRTNFDNN
jgi:hypothetical protein